MLSSQLRDGESRRKGIAATGTISEEDRPTLQGKAEGANAGVVIASYLYLAYAASNRTELTMDVSIGTEQVERLLNCLAHLRHHRNRENVNILDGLRPAWMKMSAWDVILDDLEAQRYREPAARPVRLAEVPVRLVEGPARLTEVDGARRAAAMPATNLRGVPICGVIGPNGAQRLTSAGT